jgi:hypothetical protein
LKSWSNRKWKTKIQIRYILPWILNSDSSLWFCGQLEYIRFVVGYSNTQLPHAISGLYNSFPIPICGLRILIYTIPFLFQYAVFEYLYILQLLNQQNYRVISLLLYRLKTLCYIGCSKFAFLLFFHATFLDGFVSLMWCFYVFLT